MMNIRTKLCFAPHTGSGAHVGRESQPVEVCQRCLVDLMARVDNMQKQIDNLTLLFISKDDV